jgi:hypothetical protein
VAGNGERELFKKRLIEKISSRASKVCYTTDQDEGSETLYVESVLPKRFGWH